MKIPIREKNGILTNPPDYILTLAWNFFDSIKNNNKDLEDGGSKFINIKDLQL